MPVATETAAKPARVPWNRGTLVDAKPSLQPSLVWSIGPSCGSRGRKGTLAPFNLTIDSKLRGCDVVAIRVDNVAPSGYSVDRAPIRQKKTGRPVRFELTDQTRMAIDECLRLTGRKSGQFLFAGRGDDEKRGLRIDIAAVRATGAGTAWGSTLRSSARTRCDARRQSRPIEEQENFVLSSLSSDIRRRTFEDREHPSLPRHRRRRRDRDRREDQYLRH